VKKKTVGKKAPNEKNVQKFSKNNNKEAGKKKIPR